MSKLKIKDISHLDVATSDPKGGGRFGVRDEFQIDEDKFKVGILFDFQANIKANPKSGQFDVDYGYLHGAVVALGKNAGVSLGGGVSTN